MFDPTFFLSIQYVLHIDRTDEHDKQHAGPL